VRRFIQEWCPAVLVYEMARDSICGWVLVVEWIAMETCEYVEEMRCMLESEA
jgi:hypothetical protein